MAMSELFKCAPNLTRTLMYDPLSGTSRRRILIREQTTDAISSLFLSAFKGCKKKARSAVGRCDVRDVAPDIAAVKVG